MSTRALLVAGLALFIGLPAAADEPVAANPGDADDFNARLQAGRDAAYQQYILKSRLRERGAQSVATEAVTALQSTALSTRTDTALSGDLAVVDAAKSKTAPMQHASPRPIARVSPHQFFFLSHNRSYRQPYPSYGYSRYSNYAYPSIFQPLHDCRYRRSQPRLVTTRTYVPAHWTYDGAKYHYVPGRTEVRTFNAIIPAETRYYWTGSHYSITTNFE